MKKILLVEDDTFIRDMYEETLGDSGYEVVVAVDGQEGLEKLKSDTFDLVLLDIMMPKLDGLQVLKEFDGQIPSTVVMLTNLGQEQVIKNALGMGAAGYLIKSELDPSQIVQKVEEFVGPGENDEE